MAWAAIIDGKLFMFWFEVGEREDQHRYLQVLEEFLWPKIRTVATRR